MVTPDIAREIYRLHAPAYYCEDAEEADQNVDMGRFVQLFIFD